MGADFVLKICILIAAAGAVTGAARCNQIAGARGPIDRSDLPIEVSNVRGSVHLVEDFNYWKTNSVLFADKQGIVFIDGGWTTKSARQLLWKSAVLSEANFLGVVVTAFPLYRTGGLWEFHEKDIPVYMQRRTPDLLRAHWVAMQNEMSATFGSWRADPPLAPDFVFDGDLKFLGGRVTVLYPGGAHTPDNCVVYFPQERVLYGGSLIAWPPHFLQFARPEGYANVLKTIRALDFDTVIAGHGRALHDRSILDRLEQEMNRLAREPATPGRPRLSGK